MGKPKFKVGDLVMIPESDTFHRLPRGVIFKITSIRMYDNKQGLMFDYDKVCEFLDYEASFTAERFKKVSRKSLTKLELAIYGVE